MTIPAYNSQTMGSTNPTEGDDASRSSKNFGLTQNQFKELVKNIQNGDETLFETIYLSHFDTCLKYLLNNRNCTYEEAYTSTMETLIEIRKELIQEKISYGNLAYFFTYRASKILFKIKQKNKINLSSIDDLDFKDDQNLLETLQTQEMTNKVSTALKGLCEDCQRLLKLYYYDGLSWPKIAKIYHPDIDDKMVLTKSDTLKKRAKRKCLPKFKALLEKII